VLRGRKIKNGEVLRGRKKYVFKKPVKTTVFRHLPASHQLVKGELKVFSNEKRGGLRIISFDRSPFKLLSRKFSTDSVQASSCERHKTTQRTPVSIICKQLLIPNIG
jgi:hypothetical protein